MGSGNNKILSDEFKSKVVKMITNLEQKSLIEFVPCITSKSSNYRFTRLIISLILSFIICFLLVPVISWNYDHYWIGLFLLGVITALNYLFFSTQFLKFPFNEIQNLFRLRVRQKALAAFYELKISQQAEGNGILFYMSVFEKKFYLIPDNKVLSKLDQSFWDNQILKLELLISQSDLETAVEKFLTELFLQLEKTFPVLQNQENKNHIENVWIDLKK